MFDANLHYKKKLLEKTKLKLGFFIRKRGVIIAQFVINNDRRKTHLLQNYWAGVYDLVAPK